MTFDLADFFIESQLGDEKEVNFPEIEVPDDVLQAIQRYLEGPIVQNEEPTDYDNSDHENEDGNEQFALMLFPTKRNVLQIAQMKN